MGIAATNVTDNKKTLLAIIHGQLSSL